MQNVFIMRGYQIQNFQSCCSNAIETHCYSDGLSTKTAFSVYSIRLMHCLCMLNNDSDTFPLRLNVMTSLYDLEKITYAFLYYLESENIFKNALFNWVSIIRVFVNLWLYINLFSITKHFLFYLLANIIVTIQVN